MNFQTLCFLCFYSLGMAIGQIFFKLASKTLVTTSNLKIKNFIELFQCGYFIAAIVLYGLLTLYWVWLLTFIPLNKAYPFVSLSFIFTFISSYIIFKEQLSLNMIIGVIFISIGLLFISEKGFE